MIQKRVSQQYIQLNLSDSLALARTSLEENPGFVAVVLNDQAKPVTMITSDDLVDLVVSDDQPLAEIAGQIPPGVIAEAARPMEEFVNSPEFSAFSSGARGVIVFDQDQLAGILTKETITKYLQDESKLISNLRGTPMDTRLAGSIVNNPIIMYCEEFSHRNELDFYNRHNPPECQDRTPHPHPIRKRSS
jgi:hypothetical protein